jgi:hypothetical protein
MDDIRTGTCPLCRHNEVIAADAAEFGDGVEYKAALAYEERWVMRGRNPWQAHGALEIYACRRCGFAQWFVTGPQDVPIGSHTRTRLITGPDTGGPFR